MAFLAGMFGAGGAGAGAAAGGGLSAAGASGLATGAGATAGVSGGLGALGTGASLGAGSSAALTGAGAAGIGSSIAASLPYIQAGTQLMKAIGPQGGIARGDPLQAFDEGMGLYGSYDKLSGSPASRSKAYTPDLPGDEKGLKSLTPELKREIMKLLAEQ